MAKFTIGKYLPYDTILHRIDPRIKIMSLLILLIGIFIPVSIQIYALLLVFIGVICKVAKLKMKFIISALKPMLFMLIFLLIINTLTLKTGDLLVTIFTIEVYSGAIYQTVFIAIRLILMIMLTTLLTTTTKPLDLTLGIEDLLSPFKKIGLPAHEIAMMISIALRFIPTLIEEAERIMKAQASRGLDLEEGKLKEKAMAILALIVPLFVSALQRAEDLANAMEARGYIPGEFRTRYRKLKIRYYDYITIAIAILIAISLGLVAWL